MSALSTRAEEYLALRRSLGFTLRAEGRLLQSFVDFADEEHLATVTIEAALRWAAAPSGTSRSWHAQRLGVVRGFARHLRAIGDCCEVPPPELLAFPKGRAQPYLYSQAEIGSLMDAARALVPELRAATYETVIGLLATTGMRGGEAIRLDRSDVDLGGGMTASSPCGAFSQPELAGDSVITRCITRPAGAAATIPPTRTADDDSSAAATAVDQRSEGTYGSSGDCRPMHLPALRRTGRICIASTG